MKTRSKFMSVILVLSMLIGIFAVFPITSSAAINAVWWTDPTDNTDFTASFDPEIISSGCWYRLTKYNEAMEDYVQVYGSYASGYVGAKPNLYFEEAIRLNGSGKYKVEITLSSGVEYESATKTFTFTGTLDAPTNLRWTGEIVRWDPVEGADTYYVMVKYQQNENSDDQIWSTGILPGNTYCADFTGSFSNPGVYYFEVEARSEDEMLASSKARGPEKTVEYEMGDLGARFGSIIKNERKYAFYTKHIDDATGLYLSVSKKDGDEYAPLGGVGGKIPQMSWHELYDVFEANGAGDYRVEIFAFNTSPAIPVSEEAVLDITFTPCEHDFTKKIEDDFYLYRYTVDCREECKYYYACQYCGEKAPMEDQYIYTTPSGSHDMIEEYQANEAAHWHGCSKCDYVEHHQPHTLDENNYCATCDTTVYEIWVGDTQITSKNCDDLFGDGSVFYMPELNRLFLTNYTDPDSRREGITVIDPDNGNDYVAMIYAKNGLNLHFRGENFLYEDVGDIGRQYAVVVENGDLKIEGNGSLYTDATVGFYTMDGDIYIDKNGGLLEVAAGRYAFSCEYHKLYINDGKVKARSYAGKVYTSAPVLDDYGCYYSEISEDYDGDDPEAFTPTVNIKYFYIESARMVTIMPADGEGEIILQPVRKGSKFTFPECPYTAPTGKQFYRWYLDSWTNKGERVAGETITITEDITITPVWTDKTLYTITAVAGEHGWITPVGEVSVIEGENQRFTITPDAGNGYRIKDIKVNGVSVGTYPYYIFENVTADAIIEAEFVLSDLVLTANYNGTVFAGNKLDPDNISITTHLASNPMKKTVVSASDVEYWYNGARVEDPVNYVFGADMIGDVNITVKYEGAEATMTVKVIGHQISFNANGGTGTMDSAEYAGAYTLPACAFTAPAGKTFKGWSTSENGEVIEGTTYNVTEEVELFAIWEDIPHTHTDENADGTCDGCGAQMGTGAPESPENPENLGNNGNGDDDGLGAGAIVGIVLCSVAVLGGGFALFWFVIKKKTFSDLIAVFKK